MIEAEDTTIEAEDTQSAWLELANGGGVMLRVGLRAGDGSRTRAHAKHYFGLPDRSR
jgi:hypothetical protein